MSDALETKSHDVVDLFDHSLQEIAKLNPPDSQTVTVDLELHFRGLEISANRGLRRVFRGRKKNENLIEMSLAARIQINPKS